jgi:hypothetical protein
MNTTKTFLELVGGSKKYKPSKRRLKFRIRDFIQGKDTWFIYLRELKNPKKDQKKLEYIFYKVKISKDRMKETYWKKKLTYMGKAKNVQFPVEYPLKLSNRKLLERL